MCGNKGNKVKVILLVATITLSIGMISKLSSNGINPNNEDKLFLSEKGYIPKNGFIPDSETAIKIAQAIWLPIFGNLIYESKPFHARLLEDSIWIIEGTLPEGAVGGVPYAAIRKSDCSVLKVVHTK